MASMFPRFRCLAATLALAASGCTRGPRTAPAPLQTIAKFVSPSDDLNRPVNLKAPAKRVIVIGPGALETIFALGAGDAVVGRDSVSLFPLRARKIEIAGDFQGPSVEKCVGLRPDLLILQGETWDKARADAWQKQIGVPVAALNATSLNNLAADFEKLGVWLGQPKAGIALAKTLENKRGQGQNPAFVEIQRSPLWGAGQNTLVDDALRAGGFTNAAASVRGYQPFSLESLLAKQPAIYIVPSAAPREQVLRDLRASPALSKLKSVREGRVLVINGDLLLRPGPRLKEGIETLRAEAKKLKAP
jgi:ABC-type Fe3+-hydroxamate transport system substrate-binding protein